MLEGNLYPMNNHLEQAAQRTLAKITGSEEALKPLYLQPDRAIFLASNSGIILKVYIEGHSLQRERATMQQVQASRVPIPEIVLLDIAQPSVLAMKYVAGHYLSSKNINAAKEAGMYIEKFHRLETSPPFSGGQTQWDEFILWWSMREIGSIERLDVFTNNEIAQMKRKFDRIQSVLAERPIAFLHGDLQAEHVLVNPQTQKVVAFLDFADAQPGDPLLDIAVLSLWDHQLADRVLEGYASIENNEQTKQLLSQYRLLRHISEIPWLLNRGFKEPVEKNVKAIKKTVAISN